MHSNMKATMHDLATELLEDIFALACTDGGYTGCSLSLVSKYIRAASRCTRFHSISLVSGTAQQLANFLLSFDAEYAAARAQNGGRTPLVRHLCIAAAEGEDKQKSWRRRADNAAEAAHDAKEHARYTSNLISLLQRVAPRLYTLSLIHWQRWPFRALLHGIECAGFPLLRELTLVGPDPFIPAEDSAHALYPRLARLHVVNSFENLPCWLGGGRAPRITHLRLTNFLGQIIPELKALVESEERDKLPYLEQFVIQPLGPPAPGARCGHQYFQYRKLQERFQEFLAGAAFPIQVFPHDSSRTILQMGRWSTIAKRYWLDRLEGGPGCWAVNSSRAQRRRQRTDSD